jgi:glycerol-3-phosphate acyltransferase PlsX
VAQRHADVRLFLVGREEAVRSELQVAGWAGDNIEVVAAEAVIDMGDSPIDALRRKKGSSIEVAARLVKSGRADAVVSAGNTGACVAVGTLCLGLLPEVRRAGIAVTFQPGPRPVVVIDVGANVACKAEHLLQYGIMASLYAREVLGVESPRVGLLNVGEESEKGNSLAKMTNTLFQRTALNFAGNIEGVDVFSGDCDVIVCDGFVGNIVLKVSEGLAERMVDLFQTAVEQAIKGLARKLASPASPEEPDGRVGGLLRDSLGGLREKIDYSEYGGAPLLGVNGVMIIAHGRSDSKAIANAIRAAWRMSELNLNRHIAEEIRAFSGLKETI